MYKKKSNEWIKHLDFEIVDLIMLEIAYFIAYFLRNKHDAIDFSDIYLRIGITMAIFDVIMVAVLQSYRNIVQRWRWEELFETIKHVTLVEGTLLVYEYMIKEAMYFSRTVFLLSWGLGICFCFAGRIILKRIIRIHISKEKNQDRLLMISTENRITEVANKLNNKPYREYKISCISIPESNGEESQIDANIPIIYGPESLKEYIRNAVVDEVYIDSFTGKQVVDEWVPIFLEMGVTVHVGTGFLPYDLPNRTMGKLGEEEVITTSIKTAGNVELRIKRIADIVGGIVGLILTGIMFPFVAIAIEIADPGPIFFAQDRVGKNGRIFKIYKFRSMYVDAEKHKKELEDQNTMQGLMFKVDNDPRIIGSEKGDGKGLGNFLRKTSIDEFPQFWNVLKGEMSLVGVRPPTVDEYEQYDLKHKIRLGMKPGITGLWQTSGRSEITDFEEVVAMDTQYIKEWNLGLDIKLLFKTIKVVITRQGSK